MSWQQCSVELVFVRRQLNRTALEYVVQVIHAVGDSLRGPHSKSETKAPPPSSRRSHQHSRSPPGNMLRVLAAQMRQGLPAAAAAVGALRATGAALHTSAAASARWAGFDLTEDQLEFQHVADTFAREELAPFRCAVEVPLQAFKGKVACDALSSLALWRLSQMCSADRDAY